MHFAEKTPEQFSPNVLLRPLIQDHLFPTLAYVGGPSEVAYFAQSQTLYSLFDRPMPVIWPRNSYTLIEPQIGTALDRLGIEIRECFQGKQQLTDRVFRDLDSSKSVADLDMLQQRLDRVLTDVRPEAQVIESPLVHALETARRKITHNIQKLRSRIIYLEATQNSSIPESIDLLLNNCFPNQNLQERELSIHHFLARLGQSFLDTIHSSTEIDNFAHRVLRL